MQISFTILSRDEYLPYVKEICMGIMRVCGTNSEDARRIQLAIEEAAINAIRHAYLPGEDGLIEFMLKFDDSRFSAVIKDGGKGIEPGTLKAYDVNDVNSIASPAGRGLFLMQAMMDEFRVDSIPGKGTQVYISKHIRSK